METGLAKGIVKFLGVERSVAYPKNNRAEAVNILHGRTYARLDLPGDTRVVVDVGANVGISAMFFAMTYPQATVFAFEPFRESFNLARSNCEGIERIRLYNYGLDGANRSGKLYIGERTSTTNSLFAGALWNSEQTVQVELREAGSALRELGVEQIDILKMDTEGCEVPILKSILAGYRPRIVHLEYHSDADRRALDSLLEAYVAISGTVRRAHLGTMCYARTDVAPSLKKGNYAPIGVA